MSDEIENPFGEPLFLPPGFQHPQWGKYKDQPESFFMGLAVRIMVDVEVQGAPMLVPVWLDVVRFEDQVVDGSPVRMGIGVVQTKVTADKVLSPGAEVPFDVNEVFDTIERFIPPEGGVYAPLASA